MGASPAGADDLRRQVALACRILAEESVSRGFFGHVSVRAGDDKILIKARGPEEEALAFASAGDVILVGPDGRSLDDHPGLTPPSETAIHLGIYRARAEASSVVHAHPSWTVILDAAGHQLLPLYGAYDPHGLRLLLDGLPTYPRSVMITTPQLGDEVAETLGQANACLLRGHGIVTVGGDVQEAVARAVALCELARINCLARMLGDPRPISEADVAELELNLPRGSKPRRRSDGDTPLWHYYRKELPD